jgi:hypothetical protein
MAPFRLEGRRRFRREFQFGHLARAVIEGGF